jgi:RHS repeat-associated protein
MQEEKFGRQQCWGYAYSNSANTMCGLSHGDTNQSYDDIDFAIYIWVDGMIYIYEDGAYRGQFGSYTVGDTLRVAVEGGVVKYRKNGQLLYTSGTPTYPLLVDTSIYPQGSQITNVVISGNLSGGGTDIEWLVTDQLGTPRMIFDKTGSLAGMKRHDYLPFGEELSASQNGRTPQQGYTADNTRQKFTQKERDTETGLDYFLARYYSSTQGRFTSPDEFTGGPTELFEQVAPHNPTFYADIAEPQSLNKYQYALNNPLRDIDPDGHQTRLADLVSGGVAGEGAGGRNSTAARIRNGVARVGRTVLNTLNGAASAVSEDNGFGPMDAPQNSGGRGIGHVVALAQSGAEVVGGLAVAAGGGAEAIITSPAAVTVVGAAAPAAGVAVTVGGVVTAAHGALVGVNTVNNIFSRKTELSKQKKDRSVEGATENLKGLQEKQKAQTESGGDRIRTGKSEQNLDNELRKIKSSKDVQE